jgi:hypothetical protein
MNRLVSRHVNHWFQSIQHDGQSPAITIRTITDLFLRNLQRFHLNLWIPEREFRRHICEATCTMYVAAKKNILWYGPFSSPLRPDGWTPEDEHAWHDHLQFNFFSYELWQNLWSLIPTAYWETKIPHWRDSIERIYMHYIMVDQNFIDENGGYPQQAQESSHAMPIHYEDD